MLDTPKLLDALHLLASHTGFAPYRAYAEHCMQCEHLLNQPAADFACWVELLNDLRPSNFHVRFVVDRSTSLSALAFESAAIEQGEINMRPHSLHDVINAFVWLRFPQTKRAIS